MHIFSVFFFLFGLCIGSFLNVVVLRHNTGLGISRERSMCFTCGRTIPWYENMPVLSFLLLRGRCSVCGARISLQYPAVELLTGLLFLSIWLFIGDTTPIAFAKVLYYNTIFSLLIVILVYDIKHKIIPNIFVYSFAFLALFGLIVSSQENTTFLLDILAGPLFFAPFYLLWFFSGGKWIGLGDGKLALGIGWMLGLVYGLSAIVLSFWIGALVGIVLIVFNKLTFGYFLHISMKSEIPFAPFLILSVVIEFFWALDIVGISALI